MDAYRTMDDVLMALPKTRKGKKVAENLRLLLAEVTLCPSRMVSQAVRYCLGRKSYAVGECCDWVIKHWHELPEHTRALIEKDVEQEFVYDANARKQGIEDWLGHECDRADWEKVRSLWRPADA